MQVYSFQERVNYLNLLCRIEESWICVDLSQHQRGGVLHRPSEALFFYACHSLSLTRHLIK